MNKAAGLIGFVCLMLFRLTDFPTVFHDSNFLIYGLSTLTTQKILD